MRRQAGQVIAFVSGRGYGDYIQAAARRATFLYSRPLSQSVHGIERRLVADGWRAAWEVHFRAIMAFSAGGAAVTYTITPPAPPAGTSAPVWDISGELAALRARAQTRIKRITPIEYWCDVAEPLPDGAPHWHGCMIVARRHSDTAYGILEAEVTRSWPGTGMAGSVVIERSADFDLVDALALGPGEMLGWIWYMTKAWHSSRLVIRKTNQLKPHSLASHAWAWRTALRRRVAQTLPRGMRRHLMPLIKNRRRSQAVVNTVLTLQASGLLLARLRMRYTTIARGRGLKPGKGGVFDRAAVHALSLPDSQIRARYRGRGGSVPIRMLVRASALLGTSPRKYWQKLITQTMGRLARHVSR